MDRRKIIFIGGTIIGIIGITISVIVLSGLRSATPESTSVPSLPLVTTVVPEAHEGRIMIQGNGTVQPLREVTLMAEVSGTVIWVADEFVTGGTFRQGQKILQIDSTDYVNAVTMARAEVVQRQFDLLKAEEEMAIAREEWALLATRTGMQRQVDSTELGSLVFKEPQWKAAIALLQSAEARLNDAEKRLERTRITAPYNGRLRTKAADLGQFVAPGQMIASYHGTDMMEISVPVSGRDVSLLGDILSRRNVTARARILARYAGSEHEWTGVVHRTEGALEEATRTLNVIVRVRGTDANRGVRPPLLIGTFVTVYLEGRYYEQYFTLPRETLQDGGQIWVVRNGQVYPQPIEIFHEVEDTLYTLAGITTEDSVVTNTLDVVTEGMRVRTTLD